MGILFISHSSSDNPAAMRVRDWLHSHGWNQVFLDLDPADGIAAGRNWQQQLRLAGERCSAVVILISPNWVASRWCQTEFLLADQLGKKIFPVLIAPTPFADLPVELRGKFQIVDVSTPEAEEDGFQRLSIGLKRSGLDPKSFPWPPPEDPHRPIYRGLQALEESDAAIFFGRDALITKSMDALRRMRGGAAERVLVILGASGAGKSSFLKAGILARLRRDEENFIVFPVIRPERATISSSRGLAASLGCDPTHLTSPESVLDILNTRREVGALNLRRFADSSADGSAAKALTIVIAVDQAEELFSPENVESSEALEWLAHSLRADDHLILIVTIRSDAFSKLQEDPRLADIPLQPFSLPPLPTGSFKEVIEGPAKLADPPLTVDPALTDRLLSDLAAEDALPLLAFTLERLASRRSGEILSLAEYERFGGLQGAIARAVDAALSEAIRDPLLPNSFGELEKLIRAAFIPWLVHLDDAMAESQRRVERRNALPEETRALVGHLIDQRLLVAGISVIEGRSIETVEVAHEAILRQWPALRAWIDDERDALRELQGVRSAAAEWQQHAGRSDSTVTSWLAHRGARLQEAEALLARVGYATAMGELERDYIAACRARENEDQARERRTLARTRILQRNIAIVIAIGALLVVIAAMSVLRMAATMSAAASQTLLRQAAAEADAGNYDSAARYSMLALTGTSWPPPPANDGANAELSGAMNSSTALAVLRGHSDEVLGVSFSPDAREIVTASRDCTARVWTAESGGEILVLRGHKRAVVSAAFSNSGRYVVTASADRTARIWDARTGKALQILAGHTDKVVAAAFSRDDNLVVTGSEDRSARVWDAKTGRQLKQLLGHEDRLTSVAFSADGSQILTASADNTARIWNATNGRQLTILRGHTGAVESASFGAGGKTVLTASDDDTVRIWDASTGEEVARVGVNGHGIASAALDKTGNLMLAASDNAAGLWRLATQHELVVFRGHDRSVNSVAFSPDGKRVATASDDRTARVWDETKALRFMVFQGHTGIVYSAAFNQNATRILTASADQTVRIWDPETGKQIAQLQGHDNIVETAAFSPDGSRIVSASDDGTARVWDTGSRQPIFVLRGHQDSVFDAEFNTTGSQIVTASNDGTARVWDAGTGRLLRTITGHSGGLNGAVFSPDGKRILTASADGTARIWNTSTGRAILMLRGHKASVTSARFSPDGSRIVTASRDKTLRIWNASTGAGLSVLRGHDDVVMYAAFSRDGKRIVSASRDKTARVWDSRTMREIAILRGHQAALTTAAFDLAGTKIVTASEDGTARVWDASQLIPSPSGALIAKACGTTLSNGLSRFSPKEIESTPVLDPTLVTDACRSPGITDRLSRLFWSGLSR